MNYLLPKFSIILATKDGRAPFLNRFLQSINMSGLSRCSDFEVVVIENGEKQTDKISRICAEYLYAKYYCTSKSGKSNALNLGIQKAKGEHFVFTDDDVIVDDCNWLNLLCDAFNYATQVGYVSGNVKAYELKSEVQIKWENKGGLSKGEEKRIVTHKDFREFRLTGFPIRLIAAGANSMIPKAVFKEIGLFDKDFGPGGFIPHGESLDICYRILRAGYTAIYEPQAVVFHSHPSDSYELYRKLFVYGVGDTAVHTKFFLRYLDIRSLFEVIYGRTGLWIKRFGLRLLNNYPLNIGLIMASIAGSILGPVYYFRLVLSKMTAYLFSLYRDKSDQLVNKGK
jgi:O-antigen biosynthesis protein